MNVSLFIHLLVCIDVYVHIPYTHMQTLNLSHYAKYYIWNILHRISLSLYNGDVFLYFIFAFSLSFVIYIPEKPLAAPFIVKTLLYSTLTSLDQILPDSLTRAEVIVEDIRLRCRTVILNQVPCGLEANSRLHLLGITRTPTPIAHINLLYTDSNLTLASLSMFGCHTQFLPHCYNHFDI